MNNFPTTVLLAEADLADGKLIEAALAGADGSQFYVESVTCLADALRRLGQVEFDAVLLDLMLADAQGMEVFNQVSAVAANALIMVLSTAADEALAKQAVVCGAQDYLVKSHVEAYWLPRALQYLIERKEITDALRISEARFRSMSEASPLGIFVSDTQGNCVYTNPAYQKISGLNLEQSLGTNWSKAIHPEDRPRVLADWQIATRGHVSFQTEFRFLQASNSVAWTRVHSAVMQEGNKLLGLVQTVEDITERKRTEQELRASEEALYEEKERAEVTLNSIGDAVLTTDIAGNVRYMNQVAEMMTGWSCEEASGQPLAKVFDIVDDSTRQVIPDPAQRAMAEDRIISLSLSTVLIRRDGFEAHIEDSVAPIHNREGQVVGAVIVFHDVSASRAMTQKMSYLAQHDFLTGLPNRVLFAERFAQAIGLAQRHRKMAALLYLDLDHFKNVNDSLGHAIGDKLLQSVANILVSCVRASDTVCRQGGDEFVILLGEMERSQDAAHIAEKILTAFASPQLIGGHELHVTLSIGVSIYPDDNINPEKLMQNADTAMFHAKAAGRNNYQFFRIQMNTLALRRLAVENSLRRALRDGEFVLHYQPQINLASGEIMGAEALIRWQDPHHGLVQPEQFISIAEGCGLIVPIGAWVLREACMQVQIWLDAGLDAVPVSVNISAVEFKQKNFLEGVARILKETGLAPRYLELELTESILMSDAASSVLVLEALKAMGIKLAMDDFGTGYSSLSYLKRFPIDTLKIDQSFVSDINTNGDDGTIVSAVIGMGKNLGQRVIAEGVETVEQFDFLCTHKCEEGQGFHFSPPLCAEDFQRLLVRGNSMLPEQRSCQFKERR